MVPLSALGLSPDQVCRGVIVWDGWWCSVIVGFCMACVLKCSCLCNTACDDVVVCCQTD